MWRYTSVVFKGFTVVWFIICIIIVSRFHQKQSSLVSGNWALFWQNCSQSSFLFCFFTLFISIAKTGAISRKKLPTATCSGAFQSEFWVYFVVWSSLILIVIQFTSGIYFFPVPCAGLFSVKIWKKIIAINNLFVNEMKSGQPNKRLFSLTFRELNGELFFVTVVFLQHN